MNKVYLYDGKFKSLLILVFNLIKFKKIPLDIKSENEYEPNLIDVPVYVNIELTSKMFNDLTKILPLNIYLRLYYAYLSNNKNKELIIYTFLNDYLIYKENIINRRNIDSVNDLIKISKYVGSEAHKLKGFLRFKKMKDFYYAEMEPTNNVISILANHFKKRLSNEYWVIADTKRGIYAFYNKEKIEYINKEDILKFNLDLSSDEIFFEKLWKEFFNTIAIKARKNLKCQMNFMPKKYWKNIIEMENYYEGSNM